MGTNWLGKDDGFREASWEKKGKMITGSYRYNPSSDTFTVKLDKKDSVTGLKRVFEVWGETPDFNGWIKI